MHQIIVDMICPQSFQLLRKALLHAFFRLDQIVGKLGCYVNLIPDVIFLQNLSKGSLASRIYICGIVVVYSCTICSHNLLFRLVHIDFSGSLRKTHAAIS